MVNESLIVKTLQGLKASKASGLDNISLRMLKDAAVVVAKPLTRIVIESLAVPTLQTFYLGKHDLLTVYLGKLDFLSVTDFSLGNLPRGNFIVWVLDMSRKQ